MDYKDYDLEDFLADPFFVNWVKNPDASSIQFWEKWLKAHPEKSEVIERARNLIDTVNYKYNHQPSDSEYLQVVEKIHQNKKSRLYYLTKDSSKRLGWQKVAASLSILCLIGFGLFVVLSKIELNNKKLAVSEVAPTMIIKEVPKGQKLRITLPDGSKIKVNSESRVSYSSQFNKENRDVFLEGEAYFEVTRDSLKPFRVITPSLETKVLGTAFNVKLNADSIIKVVVEHGKVESKSNIGSSILKAGDMVTYSAKDGTFSTAKANLEKELAWKNDIILLDNTSFLETIVILEKWYGVTFIVDKEVSQIESSITGKFQEATLEDVLDGLDFSTKLNYQFERDTVWLKPKERQRKNN